MHGHQLDAVALADPAGLQAELLALGRLEVGEERPQRGILGVAGEAGGRVEERVEVGRARAADRAAARATSMSRPSLRSTSLIRSGSGCAVCARRWRSSCASATSLVRASGENDSSHSSLSGSSSRASTRLPRSSARSATTWSSGSSSRWLSLSSLARVRGVLAQHPQVGRTDPPAGPASSLASASPAVASYRTRRGHDVAHLGHGQQAAQADHLDRDVPLLQRPADRGELRALAGQDGDVLGLQGERLLALLLAPRQAVGAVSWPSSLAMPSAIHFASSAAVSWKAQVTRPRSTRFGPGTSTGTSRASMRSGSWTRAATSSTRSPLRKLTLSWRTGAGSPAAVRKS
ncbi:hypothetical protein [[Actinomadura] parvosata]|uniref:hypothetical protein n=1 Tax=[Actinomadura] parvosata TaxID=1955412 RepID=UPI001FEA5E4B